MAGTTWEWTADWYAEHHRAATSCGAVGVPGDDRERSRYPGQSAVRIPRKVLSEVLKGGSASAPNHSLRSRPTARIAALASSVKTLAVAHLTHVMGATMPDGNTLAGARSLHL